MIQTHRCRHCGQVLEAFVEFAPGIPIAMSQQAADSRIQTAIIRHADRCPGPEKKQKAMRLPRPKPVAEPKRAGSRKLAFPAMWRRRPTG